MDKRQEAVAAISAQQAKEKGRTAPWMVGEQLKDMLSREPEAAALILTDLTAGGMSIQKAAEKIEAYAGQHKTRNFACVTPTEAEEILREYFGLGKAEASGARGSFRPFGPPPSRREAEGEVNLEDFF